MTQTEDELLTQRAEQYLDAIEHYSKCLWNGTEEEIAQAIVRMFEVGVSREHADKAKQVMAKMIDDALAQAERTLH